MGILPPIYVTNGVRSCKFAEALPGVRQGFASLQKRFPACGKVLQTCKSVLQTCGKVLQPCKSVLQTCGKVLQPCKSILQACGKVLQPCKSILQTCGKVLQTCRSLSFLSPNCLDTTENINRSLENPNTSCSAPNDRFHKGLTNRFTS